MKTGGLLLKHARCYWLLLAESHLRRQLFVGMARRIELLLLPAGWNPLPSGENLTNKQGEGRVCGQSWGIRGEVRIGCIRESCRALPDSSLVSGLQN